MTDGSTRGSRLRLLRDVIVFQFKLGMEAALDIALIPLSLAAAGLDVVLGNWRQPRWFHAVLRFGERCERRIDLWGVTMIDGRDPHAEIDAVMRGIESLIRRPGTGPQKVRELRRWAATKLAPVGDDEPQVPRRGDDETAPAPAPAPDELPHWLRGDPIAEELRAAGRPVTRAAWLEAAYGSSNETALDYDRDTREWVRRHFPQDPHEPVR